MIITAEVGELVINKYALNLFGIIEQKLQNSTQQEVALKLVSGHVGLDSESLNDLQREVNKSHHLVHPNIVRMGYFWNEAGEPAFISLEYVDGSDLDQIRKQSAKGVLSWKEVQTYMLQLCDALEYAHQQKIAHRDIKPSNIMIKEGGFVGEPSSVNSDAVKLMDFGIAGGKDVTSRGFDGQRGGTPIYMSPEQARGLEIDHRSDIYSLGLVLYEMLTNQNEKVLKTLFHLELIQPNKKGELQDKGIKKNIVTKKIGRNDPCPCGSGKKYKICHGA